VESIVKGLFGEPGVPGLGESRDTDKVGVRRIEISGSTVGIPVADVVVVYVLDIRRPEAILRRNR
jgi:hypothetical protein